MSRLSGRVTGALLLLQLTGLIAPFIMLHPLNGDYLSNAARAAGQIRIGTTWLLLNGVLTLLISVLCRSRMQVKVGWALMFFGAAMAALQAVDYSLIGSLVALSREFLQTGAASAADGVMATRRSVHYGVLFSIDGWILTLYVALGLSRSVPRWLCLMGVLTVLIHFGAITLPLMLGRTPTMPLGVLMAVSHIVLSGWLLTKGFAAQAKLPANEKLGDAAPGERAGQSV